MQDRQQNDMDPAFVDYAWEQMRAQLDEAMPVKDRRRRGLWIWLLAGLLLGGTWLSLQALHNDEVEQSTTPEPTSPVASQSAPAPSPTTHSIDQATVEVANLAVESANAGETGSAPVLQPTPIAPTKQYTAPVSTPVSPVIELVTLDNPLEKIDQNTVPPAVISSENPLSVVEPTPEYAEHSPTATSPGVRTPEIAENKITSVALLPTLNLLPAFPSAATSMSALVSPVKTAPLHLFADITVGVGLNDNGQLFHLGAGAQLALHPRLELEGSIAYEAFHIGELSLRSENSDAIFLSFEEATQGAGANYAVSVPLDSLLTDVTTHRIAVPLALRWSPTARSRWRFSVGGMGAYYLKALVKSEVPESFTTTERTTVANFDLYNEDQTLFVYSVDSQDISNPNTAVSVPLNVNRWEWSWTAAAAYRFTGRLEGQLQYRGLLSSWPNAKEQLGPNSFAQLSLRYYLK